MGKNNFEHLQQNTVAEAPVTSVLSADHIPCSEQELSADEEVLQALSYKPECRRDLSLWTTLCISFAIMGLLPSFAATMSFGMGYAGTAGMFPFSTKPQYHERISQGIETVIF